MLTRFKNKSAEVNKRVRLTPVNGAIANIDNSVKVDLAILPLFNGTILT